MTIREKLDKNIADYRKDTLEIEQFLTGTIVSYSFFKSNFPEILKEFEEEERGEKEKEGMEMIKNLNQKISNYEADIYAFSFINLIARTEAFLNDVLETLYLWNKKSLITDKSISYKEIMDCDNIDELVNGIRENAILDFSHSSFKDKLEFLKKKFNLTFPHLEKHIPRIIEIFTTRNLLLHNNGLVNKTYLNINKNSEYELGEKRTINEEYIKLTFVVLTLVAKSIEEQINEKIKNASK